MTTGDHVIDHTLAGHVLLFLTTISGFVFQWMREGRRHDWETQEFQKLNTQIKKNGKDE